MTDRFTLWLSITVGWLILDAAWSYWEGRPDFGGTLNLSTGFGLACLVLP